MTARKENILRKIDDLIRKTHRAYTYAETQKEAQRLYDRREYLKSRWCKALAAKENK